MDRPPINTSYEAYASLGNALGRLSDHPPTSNREDAFYTPQSYQYRTRVPYSPTQNQYVTSYKRTVPVEGEMPDEWGYPPRGGLQVSDVPSEYVQGVVNPTGSAPRRALQPYPTAASAVPTCRYLNCYRPVTKDERTFELSEYCSLEHMRDAVQRLGFPLCPACNRCPRRTDSKFCGSLCEMWTVKRDLEMEVREELLQLGQQQEHQQRYQERQNWQSPTMGPPEMVPNVNAVASSNATRGAVSYPHRSSWRYQQ